ncbi:MAG: FtsQ-type POTRA domain-containing protein [Propionibacteriaceae bacterium]|nr:FtsQ-type POTRA domain-containing protein [Propionibacteriaceae bacterium]
MNEALTPGEFAKALQNKRDAARRRKLWLGGGLATLVVLVGLGIYLFFFSPLLAAQKVTVEGASLLSVDEVVAAAQVKLGEALLTQDLDGVTQRVENMPEVRSVDVSRQWPDTVAIAVTERLPVFLRERDGVYDWVDAEGVAFHTTPEPVAGELLAVVASVEDEQRLLADVAAVAASFPPDLRPEVVSLQAEAVDRISLALEGGRTVIWGSADQSPLKAEVVATLLTVEAKVYDVSAPGHPTTK